MTSTQEEQQKQKDFHPLKVIKGVTNVTGYGRKTHWITVPARFTQQVGYFFDPKEEVDILMDIDGKSFTVSKKKNSE